MPGTRRLALLAASAALLAAPGAARAAIVTNGDFETGNLSGWQADTTPGSLWTVYSGTVLPAFGTDWAVPAPPQGTRAAITAQGDESRQILYQDLALPPGGSVYQLSLITYYTAYAAIFAPDNLDLIEPPGNEQFRIDVMRPGAAITSVAPSDVLLTVFRTLTGDPTAIPPTQKTADLSAFAGQTVRLRLAVAVTSDEMNAGADAIAVKSNGFSIGKAKLRKKNGTAVLPVTVPDAGTLKVAGKGVTNRATLASKAVAVSGGKVKLLIKPNGKTGRKLDNTGKAKVKVFITYKPKGLSSNTEKKKLKLKES
jgi:hypothetical protein